MELCSTGCTVNQP